MPLPAIGEDALVETRQHLNSLDDSRVNFGPRRTRSRTPWVGFRISPDRPTAFSSGTFWFVNAQDGRTAGPWVAPPSTLFHAWDHRGAAILNEFTSRAGVCAFGRFDPESGRYAVFATDRDIEFLVSANGETLLTLLPSWPDERVPAAGELLTCYDLTADPPTRHPIDLTRPPDTVAPPKAVRARLGSLALSPDGRTLAVSEFWQGTVRVGPPGVTLFDTRTGAVKRRLTDPGPIPAPPLATDGAFGLVFSPDSKFVRFHQGRRPEDPRQVHSPSLDVHLDAAGVARLADAATGRFVPPPHPAYHPELLGLRDPNGSQHVEFRGEVTRTTLPNYRIAPAPGTVPQMRVVDRDDVPLCDWRELSPGQFDAFFEGGGQLAPGTTGVVTVRLPDPPVSPWADAFRRWFRRPPRRPDAEVVWYDWAAGAERVVRRFPDIRPAHEPAVAFVQAGRLAVVIYDAAARTGTVEVWDLPPPTRPWPWSVPAGVALGVLLTAAGVRLRRGRDALGGVGRVG